MLTDRKVYLNGEFVQWHQATVHLMSHSFARGSAIFEVMSFHKTDRGPAVFRLDEHLKRLFRTAELLDMKLPLPREGIEEGVLETVKVNQLERGFIKLVCYYSDIAFSVSPPEAPLDVCIVAVDPGIDLPQLDLYAPRPISACISRWRKLHPETVPVESKAAANYLNGMLALRDAKRRGFEVGIMLDTEGFVAEASAESVFLVSGGTLLTPALGTILQGISRKSLLEAAGKIGIKTAEKRIRPESLLEAEELFTACSPQKIVPIERIEDRKLSPVPGPMTSKLIDLFEGICSGRDVRFKDWLFPVSRKGEV